MAKKTSNSRIGVTLWLLTAALVAMSGVGLLSAYAADDNDTSRWVWKPNATLPDRYGVNAVLVEGAGNVSQVMVVGSVLKAGNATAYTTSSILIDPKKKGGTCYPGQVLSEGRLFPSLTVLATGTNRGWVLAAGGSVDGGANSVNSCELINPRGAGTAASTGHLKTARDMHTAIQLDDGSGRILVAGGFKHVSGGGAALSSSELYNPADGNWTETENPMNEARFSAPAVLLTKGLHSGKVLVVGGFGGGYPYDALKTCELYDPKEGKWDPDGAASLNVKRGGHTLTLLKDGRVLAAGGQERLVAPPWPETMTPYRNWEIYNPETETWELSDYDEESGTRLMFPAAFHTATLLDDNKTLLVGGDEPYAAQLYDPDKNVWRFTAEALWYPRSYDPWRGSHTATLVGGKVLVCGGGVTQCELFQPPPALLKSGVSRPVQKPLTAD